jgi:hypothetical protein
MASPDMCFGQNRRFLSVYTPNTPNTRNTPNTPNTLKRKNWL